jgi:hypothetical protein
MSSFEHGKISFRQAASTPPVPQTSFLVVTDRLSLAELTFSRHVICEAPQYRSSSLEYHKLFNVEHPPQGKARKALPWTNALINVNVTDS